MKLIHAFLMLSITSCFKNDSIKYKAVPALGIENVHISDSPSLAGKKILERGLGKYVKIRELNEDEILYMQILSKNILVGDCEVSLGSSVDALLRCDFCYRRNQSEEENIRIKWLKEGIACQGATFIIEREKITEVYIHKDYINYNSEDN